MILAVAEAKDLQWPSFLFSKTINLDVIMKNYSYLCSLFLLLAFGCKKEMTVTPSTSAVDGAAINKVSNFQKVTTIDGNVTQVASSMVTLGSGEIYQISKPDNWNGDLILYAHGYVSPFLPLAIPTEANAYVPLFTSLGYAFATTSYSENGLAIQTGIQNILGLRQKFLDEFPQTKHIYLTGGSEGGIVTTLSVERYPELYNGGLALCGPCGDFQRQLNHYGDFRVLFDYFFPNVLPGTAVDIPDQLISNWLTVYVPAVVRAISSNPPATLKLLNTAGAAYDLSVANSIQTTVLGLLWYDVFANDDAVVKLGGQPFDNTRTIYFGTGNVAEDIKLNKKVQRFSADATALQNVRKYYETSGKISVPLVQQHTTGDPLIPFWHLPLYQVKTILQGTSALFTGIPVVRYGHCSFQQSEIAAAFGALVQKVQGQTPPLVQKLVDLSTKSDGKIVQSIHN